jgi:hypothetical protein
VSATPDWYFDWARDHCVAFGFREKDAETVLAWGAVFVELFAANELHDATGRLLRSPDTSRFVNEHRTLIMRAVEAGRTAARRKAADGAEAVACEECRGMGVLHVPHPGLTDTGHWYGFLRSPKDDPRGLTRTAGVACRCQKGVRTRDNSVEAGRPLLTIGKYEQMYPNWRLVLFDREQFLKADRDSPPTDADKQKMHALIARIRAHAATTAG